MTRNQPRKIMSISARETLSKWMPVIVALIGLAGNAVYIGRWMGESEQRHAASEQHARNADMHRPMSHDLKMFVTRPEFETLKTLRDNELAELRLSFRTIDAKLDRLIERSLKTGGE